MQQLTPEGLRIVEGLAQSHGVSVDAVIALLHAMASGNGFQAQFNHPDLGGMGQWSQGGMIMIGDMFNQGLKYKVGALCDELPASCAASQLAPVPSRASRSRSRRAAGGVSLFVPGGARKLVAGRISALRPRPEPRTTCAMRISRHRAGSRSARAARPASMTPATI